MGCFLHRLYFIYLSVGGQSDTNHVAEANQNVILSSGYDAADANQICSKLHEVAVLNRLVEIYEKIDCELSPGIHGVRYVNSTQVILVK